MALIYRYLGFLKHQENLPQGVALNAPFFLNEFCGTSCILKKALKWAKKQSGWQGDKGMAEALYHNYLVVDNPQDHIATAITCFDELPKFKNHLSNKVHEEIIKMLANYVDKKMCKKLLRVATLASKLYSLECTPATQIFEVLSATLTASMSLSRQIEVYGTILAEMETVVYLKEADVDQRFLSAIALEKLNLSERKAGELTRSLGEIEKLIQALIKFSLFSDDALLYEKPAELQVLTINWLHKGADLQQTLAAFVKLDFKYREQLIHCASNMMMNALFSMADHEKLVTLQKHLRQDIYRCKQRLFDNAWRDAVSSFSLHLIETAVLAQIEISFRYLSDLYIHSIVDWIMITEILKIATSPGDNKTAAFAVLFSRVEDKLKTETSEADMKGFVVRMSQIVVGGKIPLTSPYCQNWIAKKEKELKDKDNKQEAAGPENLFTAKNLEISIENYCNGMYSLSRVLKDFEKVKTMSSNVLVKVFLIFIFHPAMTGANTHKKMALLLKNLKNGVFKHRASELNNIIFAFFTENMKNFFDDSVEPINKMQSLRYVDFLNQLFVKDVIDEELIVECLDRFLDDWDHLNDAFFTAMFTTVHIKLRPKISEEKFQEYVDHLEGYIFDNYDGSDLPLECQQYLVRKNQAQKQEFDENSVKQDENMQTKKLELKKAKMEIALASPDDNSKLRNPENRNQKSEGSSSSFESSTSRQKRTNVPRKVQRMIIHFQDFEIPEKRNEVVEDLRKLLKSENRKRILVKHMLERPKTDLKEILLHAKLLVALAKVSDEEFDFKVCLNSTIHAEYLRTNAIANFNKKTTAKLNRIELISGELWRNNLMATKKFAGLLMSKNMRLLPTESLAHLSMIVGGVMHFEGNSKLKLAVRTFEPYIHKSIMKGWSDLRDGLEDVGAELQMLFSYEASLAVSQK